MSTNNMKRSPYSDNMLDYQNRYHAENNDTYMNNQKEYHHRTKENNKEGYTKTVHCEYCNKYMRKHSYSLHSRSKSHIRNKCRVKMPFVLTDDM